MRRRKEVPVAEEREKVKGEQVDPDVEAHRNKAYTEGSEAPDPEADRRRRENDEPDVEAHRVKP
jgi:hypothetical protein